MSRNYDNWERLVAATLKREQFRQLCLAHSRETSIDSRLSNFSFPSPFPSVPFDSLSPSSQFEVNPINSRALTPEEIFVNGKPLREEELTILQSCQHPPKKLKPGDYWYDKCSGFWGKHGQKPSQIISPHLPVGGRLDLNASNGNTKITINGREITKVELVMLKFAGIICTPDTNLWLWPDTNLLMYEDGSYPLTGQNYRIGHIWNKAGMKILCSLLSLPFPPKSSYTWGEQSAPVDFKQIDVQKLLLIGCKGSGTSTIFNQAKFLYKDVPFSEDEIQHVKVLIQKNTFGYICVLLEGRETFEEENLKELGKDQSSDEFWLEGHGDADNGKSIYSLVPKLKAFSNWLLKVMRAMVTSDLSMTIFIPYLRLLEELLNDTSLQETFKRRSELERLPTVANYFLEQAADIFKLDYKPSDVDILYAEGSPSSLSSMDFSFPPSLDDSEVQEAFLPIYQLIRSSCFGFGDNYELFEIFENVRIVIICISLNDYDQVVMDENGDSVNKMMVGRKLFESIATHPSFDQINLLLLLTNYDLFEEKIKDIPLFQCDWFYDFNPPRNPTGEMAFHYTSVRFKRLYTTLTGRKLYVTRVNCLEQDSVHAALKYAGEILQWDDESEYFDSYSSAESNYSDDSS